MVRNEIGASASWMSNPFYCLAAVMAMAFLISGSMTAAVNFAASMDSGNNMRGNDDGAEIVLLDTSTNKVTKMGINVQSTDIPNVKLDLTGDIVTFYSSGEFTTFDIGAQRARDEYVPQNYEPSVDTYKSNGHVLAYFSNSQSALTVRKTVITTQPDEKTVSKIPTSSKVIRARNMTSDGDSFYWVAQNDVNGWSFIYKYDAKMNTTEKIYTTINRVNDLAVGGGKLAYSYGAGAHSYIMIVDMATGVASEACHVCMKPRISGTTFAAIGNHQIIVQNTTTGEHQNIKEDKQVIDIRVDDDKVAWSWFENVDPITVVSLKNGKSYTYQPDHAVYTFAMSGDRILMLRAKALLPTNEIPPVPFSTALTGSFMFGAIFIGGLGMTLENYRRKEQMQAQMDEWETQVKDAEAQGWTLGWDGQWYYNDPATRVKYPWDDA